MSKIFSATTKIYLVIIFLIIALSALNVFLKKHQNDFASHISGAIVPHHNMVATERTQFFQELSGSINQHNYPETIILVSPNHYFEGMGKVQTTTKEWVLNDGKLQPNLEIINTLLKSGVATNESGSFIEEHGIYNILSDVRNFFPEAKLVPIIIQTANQKELQKLNSVLYANCKNCLMLASVDFSHYQPASVAELHDSKSIRELSNLNSNELLNNVEADSGASLALLSMWAKSHNTPKFSLQNHTNSNFLLKEPEIEGTSHLFAWYESGDRVQPEQFVSFVISENEKVGVENRTIWGADILIQEPFTIQESNMILLGKLTPTHIEFFGIPTTKTKPYTLITGLEKQSLLNELYKPYQNYLRANKSGQYIRIPILENLSLNDLSTEQIKSKIKSSINLNP